MSTTSKNDVREGLKPFASTLDALKAAVEHLEYCGYGDSWERECADYNKLPSRLSDAIAAAENGDDMSTTETKVRHSALPWSVGHDGPSRPIILTGGHGMLSVDKYDERGKWSSYDNEEADCEFIVRAVNSHADMLEALEDLVRAYDTDMGYSAVELRIKLAKDAIAKARGGAV